MTESKDVNIDNTRKAYDWLPLTNFAQAVHDAFEENNISATATLLTCAEGYADTLPEAYKDSPDHWDGDQGLRKQFIESAADKWQELRKQFKIEGVTISRYTNQASYVVFYVLAGKTIRDKDGNLFGIKKAERLAVAHWEESGLETESNRRKAAKKAADEKAAAEKAEQVTQEAALAEKAESTKQELAAIVETLRKLDKDWANTKKQDIRPTLVTIADQIDAIVS